MIKKLLVLAFIVSTLIKVASVWGGATPFTMDQGRDMVDIRQMVVTHTPRLVGPTTSINGVLLGPFWYYFNLLPFIAFRGDPMAIVIWQILWFQFSVYLLWKVLKNENLNLANLTSFLLLFMPLGFNISRYFWNANSMPLFTILFFTTLLWANSKKALLPYLASGLVAGLAMQIEAAFGVIFFPFLLLVLTLHKKSLKQITFSGIGFLLTLIPQALFELRHGFVMTKLLTSEFIGKGEMLGERITFYEKWVQRGEHFINLVRQSNHLPENIVFVLFAIAFLYLLWTLFTKKVPKKISTSLNITVGFLFFTALFYLLFPQKLKIWYTLGLSIPITLVFSHFWISITSSKKYLNLILSVFVFLTALYSLKSQYQYLQSTTFSSVINDPSVLKNELTAIDWVYTKAAGSGFRVYSYLPSVYDFPYNHLFWSYGDRVYGYQPADVSYLPNQPEYIKDASRAWTHTKPIDQNSATYLIIETDNEMPKRQQAWLGNFSSLCQTNSITYPWRVEVKEMKQCLKPSSVNTPPIPKK